MKASKVVEPNKIEMVEEKKPEIGPYDILSRVRYAGICHTDLIIFNGSGFLVKNNLIKYPITLGHEWSGYVEEIGNKVTDFSPGDRVVGDTCISCWKCEDCMTGHYNICKNSYGVGTIGNWNGAFAEFIKYPERHLYKIPDNVKMDEAALIEPAAIAGYATKRAMIEPGDITLITGTGTIGLFALQFAKIYGSSITILVGRKDFKIKKGEKLGADITINVLKENLNSRVLELTEERGVNSIIETTGSSSILKNCLDIIRPGGRIIVPSFFGENIDNFNINKIVLNDVTIAGSVGSPGFYPKTIRLIEANMLNAKELITHHFRFDQISEAFKLMENNNSKRIKIMLDFGEKG
jgi:2-desacetyl-2-hydroxyethyl bacteriochlorophyllide A dehydrogenase